MDDSRAGDDSQKIEKVGDRDAKARRQGVKERLGAVGVGGDIKHISPAMSRGQQIYYSGDKAEKEKGRDGAGKAL